MGESVTVHVPPLPNNPYKVLDTSRPFRVAKGYEILTGSPILKGRINGRPVLAESIDDGLVIIRAREESGDDLLLEPTEVEEYLLAIEDAFHYMGHYIHNDPKAEVLISQLGSNPVAEFEVNEKDATKRMREARVRMAGQMVGTRYAVADALANNVLVLRADYDKITQPTFRRIGQLARARVAHLFK